ncbi:MAG: hypothetical protein E7226_02760 [Clostridiales bacterium]|nr:hypothetical protein [Clostridiales bacterium]
MKQKKRTKAIAMILAFAMVFTFIPFMGTQETYAAQKTVTIDLTDGEQTYRGAEANAIYQFLMLAGRNNIITVYGHPGNGNQMELFLDVNKDNSDDVGITTEVYDGEAQILTLWRLDGCSQEGTLGLRSDNPGLYYNTIFLEFPDIQHVDIPVGKTKFIYLADGMKACTYDDAEAAAIYTLLMDPDTRLNGNGPKIRRDLASDGDYRAYNLFLDEDDVADVYAAFQFDENDVCLRASFQYLDGYDVYDEILVNLPPARLNYYGSLPVPNEYGLEYMYTNLIFNAQVPIDDMELELSRTTFSYNGKDQKPEVVKIGGKELTYGTDYVVNWHDKSSVEPGTYSMDIWARGHYRGALKATYRIDKLAQTVTLAKTAFTKTFGNAAFAIGAKTNGDGALKYSSNNANVAVVNSAGKVTIKGVGTAKITVYAAEGKHYTKSTGKTVTVKVNKGANPLAVKAKTATIKYKKLKNKNQKLAVGKVITFVKKGQGAMTYAKASGSKKITINKTTGKVTVKKGLKKGTYKVKAKVKAAGNANYNAAAKTVTFTVIVK